MNIIIGWFWLYCFMSCALGVFLEIEDNGKGFNIEQNASGFGLRKMRERAESLGGELKLISQPKEGCQVSVYFPLPNVFT